VPFSRGQILAAPKKEKDTRKWPECFSKKVAMKKVKLAAFDPWISRRVAELCGSEDEVIEAYVKEMISSATIDPKSVQTDLKGFMGAGPAATIMKELWELLLEAQTTKDGIPALLKGPAGERAPELSVEEALRKKVEAISSKILGGSGDDPKDSLSHAKGAWGQGSGGDSSRSGFSDDRGSRGNDRDRERFRDDRRDYRENSRDYRDRDGGRDRERDGDRRRNRSRSPVRRDRSRSPPRY